jgi:hypothetical protein
VRAWTYIPFAIYRLVVAAFVIAVFILRG